MMTAMNDHENLDRSDNDDDEMHRVTATVEEDPSSRLASSPPETCTSLWYQEFNKVPEVWQLQVRESVWDTLQGYLNPNEVDYIRQEIGSRLIEDNEDLMNEMRALVDILHHFRSNNDRHLERIESARSGLHGTTSLRLLKQNIENLASTLTGRAKEMKKVNLDKLFSSPREKHVCMYNDHQVGVCIWILLSLLHLCDKKIC